MSRGNGDDPAGCVWHAERRHRRRCLGPAGSRANVRAFSFGIEMGTLSRIQAPIQVYLETIQQVVEVRPEEGSAQSSPMVDRATSPVSLSPGDSTRALVLSIARPMVWRTTFMFALAIRRRQFRQFRATPSGLRSTPSPASLRRCTNPRRSTRCPRHPESGRQSGWSSRQRRSNPAARRSTRRWS